MIFAFLDSVQPWLSLTLCLFAGRVREEVEGNGDGDASDVLRRGYAGCAFEEASGGGGTQGVRRV